jgi:hypothetical protein
VPNITAVRIYDGILNLHFFFDSMDPRSQERDVLLFWSECGGGVFICLVHRSMWFCTWESRIDVLD